MFKTMLLWTTKLLDYWDVCSVSQNNNYSHYEKEDSFIVIKLLSVLFDQWKQSFFTSQTFGGTFAHLDNVK